MVPDIWYHPLWNIEKFKSYTIIMISNYKMDYKHSIRETSILIKRTQKFYKKYLIFNTNKVNMSFKLFFIIKFKTINYRIILLKN
jgi:hypothetical protein